ncbi:MAG: DedA family protein [Lautropia sp.]
MFDWILDVMHQAGYVGVALLMLAENLFPPIPSEVVMPLAGFLASRGDLDPFGVVAAGTAGSIAGALPWYWAGRRFGLERMKRLAARHGRWLTIAPADVDHAKAWFDRHGRASVLLGRLVPAVRTLISVPAGIAPMPLASFLTWSTIGTAIWTTLLAAAGYLLQSRYDAVAAWLDPATTAMLAFAAIWYLYRLLTFGRRAPH